MYFKGHVQTLTVFENTFWLFRFLVVYFHFATHSSFAHIGYQLRVHCVAGRCQVLREMRKDRKSCASYLCMVPTTTSSAIRYITNTLRNNRFCILVKLDLLGEHEPLDLIIRADSMFIV